MSHRLQLAFKLSAEQDGYDKLTDEEIEICKVQRVTPQQYFKVKNALFNAVAQFGYIKKRDAQKICKVDVNKASRIYDHFMAVGWLPSTPPPDFQG